MNNVLLQQAMKLNRERKGRKGWQRVVSFLSAVVIFCTTYALILPAITMEKETLCGLEVHEHTEACYTEVPVYLLQCGLDENLDYVVHTHNEFCTDAQGSLVCQLQEIREHSHGANCYAQQDVMVCGLEEREAHTHSDACKEAASVQVCPLEETEGHIHGEGCYTIISELVCQTPEDDTHAHGADCYAEVETLTCEAAESEPHTHDESCFEIRTSPCQLPEVEVHIHDESCFEIPTAPCELPEAEAHTHTDACMVEVSVQVCPLEETEGHTHGEACYAEALALTGEETGYEPHIHDERCFEIQTVPCELPEVEAHTHTDACMKETAVQVCALEETEGHAHSEDCYSVTTDLICEEAECEPHTHDESCFEIQTVPCEKPEGEGHAHSDACMEAVSVQICSLEEMEVYSDTEDHDTETLVLICEIVECDPHTHDESCFELQCVPCELPEGEGHTHSDSCAGTAEAVLLCTLEEIVAHTHEDACRQSVQVQLCGAPEVVLHTHGDDCHDAEGNLICVMAQAAAHEHTEQCLVVTEQVQMVLTCQLPEHIHEDACYPLEEPTDVQTGGYLCGSGEHTHAEGCYDAEGNLICTIPEHAHEAACLVADLDLNADVEDLSLWEAAVAAIARTGNWPADVLGLARTQLGYEESARNVILTDDGLKGYTRYGAWYGAPYDDWCAMFISFCLHYAGVEGFPLDGNCPNWITELEEVGLYRRADSYTPKSGDLIFFDWDQRKELTDDPESWSDHVGLVVELIPTTEETPARIKTLEGNTGNQVAYMTYELDDPAIIGYGVVPVGNTILLTHQGPDYTVTVSFGKDAGIPETAQLAVREILPDTDEYNTYYQQSVEELLGMSGTATEEELNVSFARFFDISFVVDGQILEPTAPVDVQIHYTNAIEMAERDSGIAVHFAQDGIEVLDAETSQEAQAEDNQVDTFEFTQESFSVVGTMISTYNRSIGVTTATTVDFNSLKATSGTQYVLYTEYNGQHYAITAKTDDKTAYAIPVTVNNDGTISWDSADSRIFWSFSRNGNTGSSYYVQNFGSARYLHAFDNSRNGVSDYGTTTSGRNPSNLTRQNNGTFIAQGNNYYTAVAVNNGVVTFNRVSNSNQAARFQLALVGEFYNVWFDGTNGGMMSYYGADDTNIPAVKPAGGGEVTITLPETWNGSTKYPYKLQGWYDINTQTYYPVDPTDAVEVTAKINKDTVFYADWVAATYDVGQDNDHVVNSVDTNDFITTYVFDYNVLFNVLSQSHTGEISAASHKETWTIQTGGNRVPYQNSRSLDFAFIDYDDGGEFSYSNGRDKINQNQGDAVTSGILETVRREAGVDLLDLLFNPATDVIGKNYVGTGNYLFQYMDSTTPNYDGVHDGYYYLDARLNAASYNQTEQRFYLYDYLERTSDSRKDGGVGQYSDFLPFNSPYLFAADQLDEYTDTIRRPGYEYDAKDGGNNHAAYNDLDDATTNYFFGIRTDIEFFLPNRTNTQDEYGNYGNISTRGEHMIFDFHGDDDVWVFVDGELLLDIGGLHGVMFGQIDFSTGQITVGKDGGQTTTTSFDMSDGTHIMTVYYMERGSSQSNCAIYFNIAPRYELEITKEDVFTAEKLDGAEFTIYTCEDCANEICREHGTAQVAELWASYEAHRDDMKDDVADNTISTIRVVNGSAECWGLSAGKTYYIKETKSPEGYPNNDDLIRITLNNRGTATIETTTLHGSDGEITEGFAVIKQDVNDTLKIVALTVTNQKDEDTTQIRIKKDWNGATDLPNSITAYLTVNGKVVGREAVLSEANSWTYTWTGLPKYESDGETLIEYVVNEVQVPGFDTQVGEPVIYDDVRVEWINSEHMEDSCTYILINNGAALAYNGSRFYWKDLDDAQDLVQGLDAQWSVTTNQYGFRVMNGNGYVITYHRGNQAPGGGFSDANDYFYATKDTNIALNQVIYYLESRLVAHDHDKYFQFYDILSSGNGDAVSSDGRVFTLLRKDLVSGMVVEIDNKKVDTTDQTFLEVNKVWEDGVDRHLKDSVTVHLYADGKDTGRVVVLNQSNNWAGRFEGLPYYGADGETPVVYTVVEDIVPGYAPFDEYTEVEGEVIIAWNKVTNLTKEGNYRIVNGASALSVNSGGNLVVAANDPNDQGQWWIPVQNNRRTVLKNASRDVYLQLDGTTVGIVTNINNASAIELTSDGQVLKIDGKYLQMTRTAITVSEHEYNATLFMVSIREEIDGKPGTTATITNKNTYSLPNTGGMGTTSLTFGGISLILASALMYCCNIGRKRRKGGE